MFSDVFGSLTTNIWLIAGGIWILIIVLAVLLAVAKRFRYSSSNKRYKQNNQFAYNYGSISNEIKKIIAEQSKEIDFLHNEQKLFIQKQDKLLQNQREEFNKALETQRRQFEVKYNTLNERVEKQKNENELSHNELKQLIGKQSKILQVQHEEFSKVLEAQRRQFEVKYNTLNECVEKQKNENKLSHNELKQLIGKQNKYLQLQHEDLSKTLEVQRRQFEVRYNTLNKRVEKQKNDEAVMFTDENITPNTSFHNAFSSYQAHNESATANIFKSKGFSGEIQIHSLLIQNFGEENVFTNLYLPRQDGNHSQLDLILISCYGIYIIECKKWSGTVTGSDNDKNWSQTIVDDIKGTVNNEYASPTRQNFGHVKAFCECFSGIPESKIFSIVVFNNLCKLSVNSRTPVMHRDELVNFIKDKSKNQEKYFKDNDLQLLRAEIKKYSNPSKITKEHHKEYCNSKKQ